MEAELDEEYFQGKHGDDSFAFMRWWRDLPKQSKKLVSPRRLDYAIDIYKIGGDLEDVFPPGVNFDKLNHFLNKSNAPASSIYKVLDDMENLNFDEKCDIFTIETSMNLMPVVLENPQYHSLLLSFSTDVIEKEVRDNNRKFIRLMKKCSSVLSSPFRADAEEFQEKIWNLLSSEVREILER